MVKSPTPGRRPCACASRPRRLLVHTKAAAASLAVLGALAAATPAHAQRLSSPETSLLNTINAVRTSHGLPPVRVDYHLTRAARGHSADMMRRQYFAHGSVVGRAVAAGAHGPCFGENLAWGTGITAQWVVEKWLASPSHRAILLRPGFRRVGLGIAYGTFSGYGGAAVVTADFAGR
jgi:uncharacterized protein YkwD